MPTTARTVSVDMAETIGTLNIDNGASYTVAFVGAMDILTFQGAAPTATISTINITTANGLAAHSITAPISISANTLNINQNATGSMGAFTIGANNIAGAGSLNMNGPEILILQGTNTFMEPLLQTEYCR